MLTIPCIRNNFAMYVCDICYNVSEFHKYCIPCICIYANYLMLIQFRSFITSLLHACTRMAPRSIWRVKILGLLWKNFFPRDESWHLAWHFTTQVLAFPRHVSFPQDVDFHITSHGIYTHMHDRGHSCCYLANKPTRNLIVVIAMGSYI